MLDPTGDTPSDNWADWLRTKKWDFWSTGVFTKTVAESTALACVEQWLAQLHEIKKHVYQLPESVENKIYSAIAIERGALHGVVHSHMLVGGLGTHSRLTAHMKNAFRWGHLDISRYDHSLDPVGNPWSGACAYIVKHVEDVHIIGRMKKYRPRKRISDY